MSCPKCTACKKDYDLDTRLPLLLPCYHVTCSACVAGQGDQVTCPTCSKVKVLSESEELPRDVCTLNEVTLARLPSLPCGQCEEKGHVTHRCTMCRGLLCQNCVRLHDRLAIFRKHRPLPRSSSQQIRQQFFQEVALCQDGNSPSGFCWKCSSALCHECQDDHQGAGHDSVTLAHAQEVARTEQERMLRELDSRRERLGTHRKSAIAADSSSRAGVEACGKQLLAVQDQLLQAIQARVKHLLSQLSEIRCIQASRFESNKTTLDQSTATVDATKDYLTRVAELTQPLQFLALHYSQSASIRQLLDSPVCPPEVDLCRRETKLHTEGLQDILDLISAMGNVKEEHRTLEEPRPTATASRDESPGAPTDSEVIAASRGSREDFARTVEKPANRGAGVYPTPIADDFSRGNETERVGLPTGIAVTSRLAFCPFRLNMDDFSLSEGVLVNSPSPYLQGERYHVHSPHRGGWTLEGRPPWCGRLQRYWGTMGTLVLRNAFLTWGVEVYVRCDEGAVEDDLYLFELGVVPPSKCDVSSQALGGRGSKGCGVKVIYCVRHKGLCAKAVKSGERAFNHVPLGVTPVPHEYVQVDLTLTADTFSGTLRCQKPYSTESLCEIPGVRPPLFLFFGLRPSSISPECSLKMKIAGKQSRETR